MDFLNQARNLLDNLKKTSVKLTEIKKDIETASPDKLEDLYAEEFEVMVEITDIFDLLDLYLDRLEEDESNTFISNRLRIQAELILGEFDIYELDGSN